MGENNKIAQWGSKGEVLVFLHYFGGSAQSWQWVAEKLSDDYRCIAINLPGFGGAAAMQEPSIGRFASFVQEQLKSLGINAYTLIGHSMGGKIAMQVAASAGSGTIRQLILVAPSPPTTEPMPAKEKERMLHHPDRKEAEKTVKNATKQSLSNEKERLAVETQLMIDHATWRWWLLEGMDHSIADKIKPLQLPITVLASDDDPVMTQEVIQERVLQVLDRATLSTTHQVGHLIPLEAPLWLAQQIRKAVEAGKETKDL
jgi:pimeloyl-ACP methyl ester carboxylesterase